MTAAAPAMLAIPANDEPPPGVEAGQSFPVAVDVEDLFGNVATSFNGSVTIELANNATGTLVGTLTVTAVDGVATFSNLAIDTTGTYQLEATSNGLTSIISTSVTAFGLEVTTQPPTSVPVFQTFGLTVTVLDKDGIADPSFDGSVTVSLTAHRGATSSGERRLSTRVVESRPSPH